MELRCSLPAGNRETLLRPSDFRRATFLGSYSRSLFDQRSLFSWEESNRQRAGKGQNNEQEEACTVRAALIPKISDQHRKDGLSNTVGGQDHAHDPAEHTQSE